MLFHARVPIRFWSHVFTTALYIINRLATTVLGNKSLFEILFGPVPDYNRFKVFGCNIFPYIRLYSSSKLSP